MSNQPTQNALQGLVSTIGGILSGLSPVAKAIVAAVIPTVASVINLAFAGSFNTTSIVTLVTGLIGALAVFIVPNKTQTTVVPVPVPVAPVVKKTK